jgi:hypothetical protein
MMATGPSIPEPVQVAPSPAEALMKFTLKMGTFLVAAAATAYQEWYPMPVQLDGQGSID